jgi:serine/threonine protein kinase/Flp pilus assembly protein TadD
VDPLIGQTVAGHYEILEPLGTGAWSTVYKASQKPLNRLVAVKVMHSHLMKSPDKVARFQREAEAASSLLHPSVATVFDYGLLAQGQPFIVMECMEGQPLAEILEKEGALPVDRAVGIFKQALEGLAAAHEKGIIHRDVKPSNLFVTKSGAAEQVKILDFGVAKLTSPDDSRASLTQTGESVGTPDYMSPEQWTGQRQIDQRSDIYSFGCVMYHVLTGKQPIAGNTMFDSMHQHIYDVPDEFRKVSPDLRIPESIEAVVFKALAKDPNDRYQTCAELLKALEKASGKGNRFLRMLSMYQHRRLAKGRKVEAPIMMILPVCALVLAALIGLRVYEMSTKSGVSEVNLKPRWQAEFDSAQDAFNGKQYLVAEQSILAPAGALPLAEKIGEKDDALAETLQLLKSVYEKEARNREAAQVGDRLQAIADLYPWKSLGKVEENSKKIASLSAHLAITPHDKKTVEELATAMNNQSALLTAHAKYAEAQSLLNEAITLEKNELGEKSPEYAKSLSNLGGIYYELGRKEEAGKLMQQALAIREQTLGLNAPEVGTSCAHLGDYYRRMSNYVEAEQLLERALEIFQKTKGKQAQEDYIWALNTLGVTYMDQRKLPEARKTLTQCLELVQKLNGPTSIWTARQLNNLGQLSLLENNFQDALAKYNQALDIYKGEFGNEGIAAAKARFNLGYTYLLMGDLKKAETTLLQAFSVLRRLEPQGETTVNVFQALSQTYQRENKIKDLQELTAEVNGANLAAPKGEKLDAER